MLTPFEMTMTLRFVAQKGPTIAFASELEKVFARASNFQLIELDNAARDAYQTAKHDAVAARIKAIRLALARAAARQTSDVIYQAA